MNNKDNIVVNMNMEEADQKFNVYLQTFNDKLQKIKSGTQEESIIN